MPFDPLALRDFRLYRANPTFANPAWDDASPRVLILRLSSFEEVERSTPHLFLAGEIRRAFPAAYLDMTFVPCPEDARALEKAALPLVLGTQSRRAAGDFDLLLISNSHLLELANLPFLFARSAIPLWSSQRDERWPLVILGGSNASAAHAILSEEGECMADAIFFGEGEGAVATMVGELVRLSALSRAERLAAAAQKVDGLWPAGPRTVEIRRARRDASLAPPEILSQPVLPGAEATRARLAITLGCPCLCSFCFEGHDRRPFREIPAEAVIAAARKLKAETGASTLEIESFNFNTHRELARILIALHRIFLRVNLMSQRVDILARTPGLLDLEIAGDKHSFTLGIEGISAQQRRFLHKSLADEDIVRVLEALHGRRTREIKLFYILTGRETEADFAELSSFVKWLRGTRGRAQRPPRVVFSFGMLVRMPFTPLRYDQPVLSEATWRPLTGKAKSICETNGFEFRLSHSWPEYAATQALALPDPSLHGLLARIAEKGCVSSNGLPRGAEQDVRAWIEERGGTLPGSPFSFLETESASAALHRLYLKARAGRDDGYGAGLRSAIPRETIQELAGITRKKHRISALLVGVVFPREAAGLGTPWMESWLMRSLLAVCPGQLENVLAIRECLVGPSGVLGEDTPWFGRSVVEVTAWDAASFLQAVPSATGLFDGVVPEFATGAFTSLQLSVLLPAPHFAQPAERLASFLRDSHAPVTLTRTGASFQLLVPEKSRGKKAVLEGRGRQTPEGTLVEITVGAKFRLGAFLESFGTPESARFAEVEILRVR